MIPTFEKYTNFLHYMYDGRTGEKIFGFFIPISRTYIPVFNDFNMRAIFYPQKKNTCQFETVFEAFDYIPNEEIIGFISVMINRDIEDSGRDYTTITTTEKSFRFRDGDYIGMVFPRGIDIPHYGVMTKDNFDKHWRKAVDTDVKEFYQKVVCDVDF